MAITDKTRKLLWGRAANRCAVCRCELSIVPVSGNGALIGDECHITARNSNGPRYEEKVSETYRDDYANLILLCPNHHREIDDRSDYFTVDMLKSIKRKHELWVDQTLRFQIRNDDKEEAAPEYIHRIVNGRDLLNLLASAHAFDFQNDEPSSQEEVELLADFLQGCQDCADCYLDAEVSDHVKWAFDLSNSIKELEKHGFWIFGHRWKRDVTYFGRTSIMDTVTLRLLRAENPSITTASELFLKLVGISMKEGEEQPNLTPNPLSS